MAPVLGRFSLSCLVALVIAALLCGVFAALQHGAMRPFTTIEPAAGSGGAAGPSSRASARITVVIPSRELRSTIGSHCTDRALAGYVPIVRVDAAEMDVPPAGRFVSCASGARVFLLPSAR